MATVGGALPGRTGVLLYSAQSVQGTPVTPATAVGIASFDVTDDAGVHGVMTLGQANALYVREGRNITRATINITALQDETLLKQSKRASGVVPWTTFLFGYKDDLGTAYAWQVSDAKIAGYDVSLTPEGLVTASLNIVGGLITELTSALTITAANIALTPWGAWDAVLLKGGAAHESIGFRLNVNHNVEPQFVIPGAAPSSFKRGWAYLPEGNEVITGEITRFVKSGIDLQAAGISDFTVLLTLLDIDGASNTAVFTIANCKWGSERWAVSPEGRHEFTTPFIAKTCVIT